MPANAHYKFDGESAQKLHLLHITTPFHFPHVIQIRQQGKVADLAIDSRSPLSPVSVDRMMGTTLKGAMTLK
jgi:hypothetical protein